MTCLMVISLINVTKHERPRITQIRTLKAGEVFRRPNKEHIFMSTAKQEGRIVNAVNLETGHIHHILEDEEVIIATEAKLDVTF